MFDLVTGKATHIPTRTGAPIVISTILQAAMVGAVLLPALFLTGALPEPQTMMAFVAAPPPPPPPPPPALAPPAAKTPSPRRPVLAMQEPAAPLEPPSDIPTEPVQRDEEGVPDGVEGGVPGGVPGGVVGGLPEAPPPPPPPPVRRDPVRVGGNIREPKLLTRVEPVYPPFAVSAHLQGVVILEAIVDREGFVEQVRVLRTANAFLDRAAIDAVKQWQYSPLILNGTPERFVLTVVLSFTLTTS